MSSPYRPLLTSAARPSTFVIEAIDETGATRETSPVGGPVGQGVFLNGAVKIETSLAPRELLATSIHQEVLESR